MSVKKPQVVFSTGDLVFAKVKGYPHWPARISSIADAKGHRLHVFFYGTYETAVCKKEDLCHYNEETKEKYWKQTRKGFQEGIYEIENTPDIAVLVDDAAADIGHGSKSSVKEEHLEVVSTPTHSSATKPVQRKRKLENANDSFAPPAKTPLQKTPAKGSVPVKSPIPTSAKSKVKTPSTPLHTPTQSSATAKTPTTAKTTASVKTPATAKSSGKPKVESHSSLTPNIPTSIGLTPSKPSAKTPLKVNEDSSSPEPEKTSRSGRVIKQKKFDDEEVISTPTKSADRNKLPDPEPSLVRGPRKIWIQVRLSSDVVEVDLDQDRPEIFESKLAESEWENRRQAEVEELRRKIESGEFIPEEIRMKSGVGNLASKVKIRQEKVRWLKLEQRLNEVDLAIRKALHHKHPDIGKSLDLLTELHNLTVGALVIKKHPQVVETVRKLRKYVGPKNFDRFDELKDKIKKIRLKADSIYVKIKSSFAMPDDSDVVIESLSAERIDLLKALRELDLKPEQQHTKAAAKKHRRMTK